MANDPRSLHERLRGTQLSDLEKAIRECNDAGRLAEIMSESLAGKVNLYATRQPDGSVNYSPTAPTAAKPTGSESSKPQEDNGMLVEVWQSPDGNLRVVDAYSPSGLDAMTKQMRFDGWKRVR